MHQHGLPPRRLAAAMAIVAALGVHLTALTPASAADARPGWGELSSVGQLGSGSGVPGWVVYGDDTRGEVADADAAARTRFERSIVAVFIDSTALVRADDDVAISAAPLGVAADLCPGEPFAAQPAAARCSGVLIDDDLVLTAGHCFDDPEVECATTRLLFRYAYDRAGRAAALTTADVATCRTVVIHANPAGQEAPDYAVIQLDAPVASPREPTPLVRTTGAPALEDDVWALGFPDGIPGKVFSRATVLAEQVSDEQLFLTNLDAFAGSSGMAVFDDEDRLLGTLVSGSPDYLPDGDCQVVNRCPLNPADCGPGSGCEATCIGERVQRIRVPVDALCASGWPSERLCGVAARCGDGRCTGRETSGACAADCPVPRCGDGVCQSAEWGGGCDADCEAQVPAGWVCRATDWNDGAECDCGCGAADPDCGNPALPVAGCADGERCSEDACVATAAEGASGGCAVARPRGSVDAPWWLGLLGGGALAGAALQRRRRGRRSREQFR